MDSTDFFSETDRNRLLGSDKLKMFGLGNKGNRRKAAKLPMMSFT